MTVSIIIPLYNQAAYTKQCLETLIASTPSDYEVVLVDNASSDDTSELLRSLEGDVHIIRNAENLGFARACNQGAAVAQGEYLLFLNNDTVLLPGWLDPLTTLLDQETDVAVVGPKLLLPNGTIQHAGVELVENRLNGISLTPLHRFYGFSGDYPAANVREDCKVVTGAAMLVRKGAFEAVGGFEESYWNGYEDVDLCFKMLQHGWRVVYEPKSCLIHFGSVSGEERFRKKDENLAFLLNRWTGRIAPDFVLTEQEQKVPCHTRASIVIVTYNSQATLEACVMSALSTMRENDEIVLVDNASRDDSPQLIKALAERDSRIRYQLSPENVGFSAGTNLGIRQAKGKHIVLLNPDTVAYGGWLEQLVLLGNHPDVGAVGPTSDYVAGLQKWQFHAQLPANASTSQIAETLQETQSGQSVETKLLIGFCMLIPRRILDEFGLLDEELFLGNDDLDFSWRMQLADKQLLVAKGAFVHHVGQVSFDTQPKPHTQRLVQESTDALARKLVAHYGPGKVPSAVELWGINWFTPTPGILEKKARGLSSIIVLTWNQLDVTKLCFESLYKHTQDFELIVVDNGSTDGTIEYLQALSESHSNVKVIFNQSNRGFAGGCNQGLALAEGKYLVLLNNDTVVSEGWLDGLIDVAQDYDLVGPITNYVVGKQRAAAIAYNPETLEGFDAFVAQWRKANKGKILNVNRVIGFCLLIRREVTDLIGGLDTNFGTGNMEDDDFCMRARVAGFEVAIAEEVFIHHFGSKTFDGQNIDYKAHMSDNWLLFKEKWQLSSVNSMEAGYRYAEILSQNFDPVRHAVPIFSQNADPVELPDSRSFNIVLAEAKEDVLKAWVKTFLEVFKEGDDAALHVLAGSELDRYQQWVMEAIGDLDPEKIPDISILEAPVSSLELPAYLKAAQVVGGSQRVVQGAQDLGIQTPEPTREALASFRASL